MKIRLPSHWKPRQDQLKLWSYLENRGRRAVEVAHRRWGKDDVSMHFTACAAMQRAGNYWHMLPEYGQARKAIWDAVNPRTGKRRIDEAFPKEIRANTKKQEMMIEFINGATWQLVGSDNFDSLVGAPPIGLVNSEYALADPRAWAYLSPILEENSGWSVFIYTPRGKTHGFQLFKYAESNDDWFSEIVTVDDTPVFPPSQLENIRRDLIGIFGPQQGESIFQQEYFCSWEGFVPGAYYSKQINDARREDRITIVPHEPGHEVYTFWDLGMDDATSIWFMQAIGHKLRFIDYYEQSGEALSHYAKELQDRPYVYGDHYLPHDVEVRELGTGVSRRDTLSRLGLKSIIVVERARDQQAVLNGIDAARMAFNRCWFDKKKCAQGLAELEGYQAEYDEKKKKLSNRPLHNYCSHAADAFRTFAVGYEERIKGKNHWRKRDRRARVV